MKPRSSSEISFKKYPSLEFQVKNSGHKQGLAATVSHDLPLARTKTLRTQGLTPRKESEGDIKIINDFTCQIGNQITLPRRKNLGGYSSRSLLNRKSSSNLSHNYILPKLAIVQKKVSERGVGSDQAEQQPGPKQPAISKVQMIISAHVQSRIGKAELKQNLLEDLDREVKRSFRLRIVNGVLQKNSTYLANLNKLKARQWETIQQTLIVIDKFTRKYRLQGDYEIRYFPLMSLVSVNKPSNREIIHSLQLQDLPEELRRIPGCEYIYPDAVTKATTKIQSTLRMWRDRKSFLQFQVFAEQIRKIQRYWRKKLVVISTRQLLKERYLERYRKYTVIKKEFKQKWHLIKNQQRWEVHIPNIGVDEFKKLTTEKLIQRQLASAIHIFKIAHDFLINILFVSPIPIHEEVLSFYVRVLEINGLTDWGNRIRFVYPENYYMFSPTVSCSRTLLESPLALKRIRDIVRQSPAYIVPGQSSQSDIDLSVQLGFPIFGLDPGSNYLSLESGSLTMFKSAQIPVLLTARDIFNQEQLINTLSILMFNNPSVAKWCLKIDDQTQGRGQATISPNSFPMVRTLLKSFVQIRCFQEAYDLQNQIQRALFDQIKQNLHIKLKITNKCVYRSTKQYLTYFYLKGGVIQKPCQTKIDHYKISFVIYPDGVFHVTQASQQILIGGRVVGAVSPLDSTAFDGSMYLTKAVYRQLNSRGMIGYFSLGIIREKTSQPKFYCSGLKCHLDAISGHTYLLGLVKQIRVPQQGNCLAGSCIYCPLVLADDLGRQGVKKFFQQCRHSNIQFDVKSREGVLFVLPDTLQSGCVSLLVISTDREKALRKLMAALDFLAGYVTKHAESPQGVGSIKNRINTMLNQFQRAGKQKVETNLQWLF